MKIHLKFQITDLRFFPSAFRLPPRALFFGILLLVTLACEVGQSQRESTIPAEAQALVDRVTAQIEAGRDEEIYREAAEEWRRTASPEQSGAIFETLRTRLGKAKERARQTVHDEQKAGGDAAGHRLVIRFITKFEHGEGMETFTLVERDGRWLLAGYFVNSETLK
jgi:Protein of unknown function (DUF4019)